PADKHLHLVLEHQFLGFRDRGIQLASRILDDEFDGGAAELALVLIQIHLEAIDHVLADLGEYAGHRRNEPDTQFIGLGRGAHAQAEHEAAAQQQAQSFSQSIHCLPPLVCLPSRVRKALMPTWPPPACRRTCWNCRSIDECGRECPSTRSAGIELSARKPRPARTATTAPACSGTRAGRTRSP